MNQVAATPSPAITLLDGGFEQGSAAWAPFSSGSYPIISHEPGIAHGGSNDAWFGGYHNAIDEIYQNVTIPSGASTATLRFWYQVGTEDFGPTGNDFLDISFLDPVSKAVIAPVALLSNLNWGGWTQSPAFDVSALRGQTVRLRLRATTNASLFTSFRIDDVTIAVSTGGEDTPRLVNISTRMRVLTGDDVMIGGFIIGGSVPKTVVVRARGPSMSEQGVPRLLANPVLQLFQGPTQIAANNDYEFAYEVPANSVLLKSSGFAPSNLFESAILRTLNPGAYTAIVSGFGGTTGVAIIEVFEVDSPTAPLVNIATRGQVLTGENVMIAGFIIQGAGPQTVVVRARGPSLAASGVPGVLLNPQMELYSGSTLLGANDDWQQASNASALQSSGFAPSDSSESAILTTLAPGAYSVIVSGVGGTTGVAIVEVFAVP